MKKQTIYGFFISTTITLFLLILIIIAFIGVSYYRSVDVSDVIVTDLQKLKTILENIDKTCGIIDFDYQKNWINFLHIKKGGFVGSEVGSANLMYPEQWQGPYLPDNPTIQEKEYMVVRTKRGYFITPGEGVKLPNGKIIGTDIILDENADIARMMHDEQALMNHGKSLAVPLMISGLAARKTVVVPDD